MIIIVIMVHNWAKYKCKLMMITIKIIIIIITNDDDDDDDDDDGDDDDIPVYFSFLISHSYLFTVAGLVDSMIYHSARALQKKIDLGKAS